VPDLEEEQFVYPNDGQTAEPVARDQPARQAASGTPKTRRIAIAALVISLMAPFVLDPILGTINLHTPLGFRVAETSGAIDRLEQRSAELEKQLAAASAQLAKLQADTAQTETGAAAVRARTGTLALVQLGAALRHPGAFDLELAMVRASGATPADMVPLLANVEPYAATGIPGVVQLQRDFAVLYARLEWGVHGYIPVAWMHQLIAWPRSVILWHAVEVSPPDPNAKFISDAAGQLTKDNLAAALAAARQVTGPNRALLSDWIEDASARVAADELQMRINALVVQRAFGAGGKAARNP
jgi:hypothetical protein